MKLFAVVNSLSNGHDHDREQLKELDLQLGDKLEVRTVAMGRWSTLIEMTETRAFFNSVNFRFEDELGQPVDIYQDPRYNPYM